MRDGYLIHTVKDIEGWFDGGAKNSIALLPAVMVDQNILAFLDLEAARITATIENFGWTLSKSVGHRSQRAVGGASKIEHSWSDHTDRISKGYSTPSHQAWQQFRQSIGTI